jgi:hypothetical protein
MPGELDTLLQILKGTARPVPLVGVGEEMAKLLIAEDQKKKLEAEAVKAAAKVELSFNPLKDGPALGKEWLDWLPETVFEEFNADTQLKQDYLMALQVAMSNPDAFDDWQVFNALIAPFNGRQASFEFMDVPDYKEVAWTCEALRGLKPNVEFGPAVLRYIEAICHHDGIAFFPWVGGTGFVIADDPGKRCQELWERVKDAKLLGESGLDPEAPLDAQVLALSQGVEYCRTRGTSK